LCVIHLPDNRLHTGIALSPRDILEVDMALAVDQFLERGQ
jgi:hypothetical protein